MNIIVTPYQYRNNYNPYFTSRRVNITAEQILELRKLGKSEKEIYEHFGIKASAYYAKLKKLGLSTKLQNYNEMLSKISKEEFEAFLKQKIPVDKICEHFKITTTAYYYLMERLNLRHYILGANKKAITREMIQELVDKNIPVDKICATLNISRHQYFDLIEQFKISTSYKANREKVDGISKKVLTDLLSSGKTHDEISQILNVSNSTICSLIVKFKINTQSSANKKINSTVTKELLEKMIADGKTVDEICTELNIKRRTYTRLLNRFGIITKLKQSKANMKSVTKEQLQALVDEGYSRDEICRKLNLTGEHSFYKLLKRLGVRYNYKHHIGEIVIPKNKLEEVVDNWESKADIEDKLGICNSTFYEKAKAAKVTTVFGDSIKILESVDPKEIQKCLDEGASSEEICERFNIPRNLYHSLVQKYNLVSTTKKDYINANQITKELLEDMIRSGKSTMEICHELNISVKTYRKKLMKFEIDTKKVN